MPSLIVFSTGTAMPKVHPIYKKITTIGEEYKSDVGLDDPSVKGEPLHLFFDGKTFRIETTVKDVDLRVNGKRKKNAKLEDGDVMRVGRNTVVFNFYDVQPGLLGGEHEDVITYLKKMAEFSVNLMKDYDIQLVLDKLMDMLIELTNADKGFLMLAESGEPEVRVARNISRKDLPSDDISYSDSIVAKVLRTGLPIIVSDALHHKEFSEATSVVNLRLCSVMCVPVVIRGKVMGLIYLGNDNVVNLFSENTLELLTIFSSQAALIIDNALMVNELKLSNAELQDELESLRFGEIIGACPSMRDIFGKIVKIATTDVSVLVLGETGTGKELIAKEVHKRSNRGDGAFIVINCGAIPENLLESELFGHVRGAFTGAVSTTLGKFQQADGGTLFLDEIGELPVNLQVKLLRALQEKTVTKVGATKQEKVDIRVIAATNKNLQEEVKRGTFREDLYYRLNVINLELPPLRDRGDDVVLIGKYFLIKYAKEYNSKVKGFSNGAIRAIKRYTWPGNIRELENRLKKAVLFTEGGLVGAKELELEEAGMTQVLPLADAKEAFQRTYINQVLSMNGGNRTKTAKDLGVDPRTIFRHLEKEKERDDDDMLDFLT